MSTTSVLGDEESMSTVLGFILGMGTSRSSGQVLGGDSMSLEILRGNYPNKFWSDCCARRRGDWSCSFRSDVDYS